MNSSERFPGGYEPLTDLAFLLETIGLNQGVANDLRQQYLSAVDILLASATALRGEQVLLSGRLSGRGTRQFISPSHPQATVENQLIMVEGADVITCESVRYSQELPYIAIRAVMLPTTEPLSADLHKHGARISPLPQSSEQG